MRFLWNSFKQLFSEILKVDQNKFIITWRNFYVNLAFDQEGLINHKTLFMICFPNIPDQIKISSPSYSLWSLTITAFKRHCYLSQLGCRFTVFQSILFNINDQTFFKTHIPIAPIRNFLIGVNSRTLTYLAPSTHPLEWRK